MDKIPRIGTSCLLIKEPHFVLLGLRKGSHEAGKWSTPGGHLEEDEAPVDAVLREFREESGILPNDLHELPVPFIWQYEVFESKRYVNLVHIAFVGDYVNAILMEPDKCEEWRWVDTKDVLNNYKLFQNLDKTLKHYNWIKR